MYTFKQQAASTAVTVVFLGLSILALAVASGGLTTLAEALRDTGGRDVRGLISLSVIVTALFAMFQQVVLRLVIFRK